MPTPTVFLDDADAFVSWTVTDALGQNLDWATPQIAVGPGAYTAAEWQGAAAATREIRVAMPLRLTLTAGSYTAYLKVPNGTDFRLGKVNVVART